MHPRAISFLVLVTFATSFLISHAGACIPRERDALLAFKRGITRDPAGLLSSWQQSNEDCCRWNGVWCSNQTGHILKLQLRNKADPDGGNYLPHDYYCNTTTQIVGQISDSLLSLEQLENLDLSCNSFTGPTGRIPDFLGSLNNLKYLNLSGIQFSGRLPANLGNLSNLQYLDLSNMGPNTYSMDLSWLRHLHVLRYLNLGGVNISRIGDWPHIINMIPSLIVLDFSDCSLTSANQSIPHLNLTNLEKLYLSRNTFDQPIASCWFWNITNLKHLDLQWTSSYGQLPGALQEMTSLQFLVISQQDFCKPKCTMMAITTNLRSLCNLEVLLINGNLLYGDIAELLKNCSSNRLRELDLSLNSINRLLPNRGWGNFTSLERLDLFESNILGILPNWMGQLTSLKHLDLSTNNISGVIPKWIGQLTRLEFLHMASNNISGALPISIGQLTRLKLLDISINSITGALPNSMGELTRLEFIDLSHNNIGGILPNGMANLTSLGYLDLSENNITGPLPSFIGMLANLYQLFLRNNHLNGEITHQHFCSLKSLETIDLSSNSLNIVISSEWQPPFRLSDARFSSCQMGPLFPSWLKWLVDISNLDISNTGINDRLPDWFCSTFSTASHLDISNNQVHGGLPECMEHMSLGELYLGSNKLTGPIPPMPITLTKLDLSRNSLSGSLVQNV